MKNESKNSGASNPCPECGHPLTIVTYARGHVIQRLRCAHCAVSGKNVLVEVEIGQKPFYKITKISMKTFVKVLSIAIIITVIVISNKDVFAKKVTCKSFKTQTQAQKTFDSDPVKYSALDKGGIHNKACEMLP